MQLPAHLAHDRASRFAYGVHAECGENERQQSTDEKSDDHFWFFERELIGKNVATRGDVLAQLFYVRTKQNQRRQSCRSDRVTFGDGFHCVADRIQFVGDGTNFLGQIAHHCHAARVISDGAKGVHRQHVRGGHEHAHRRNCRAEDAGVR